MKTPKKAPKIDASTPVAENTSPANEAPKTQENATQEDETKQAEKTSAGSAVVLSSNDLRGKNFGKTLESVKNALTQGVKQEQKKEAPLDGFLNHSKEVWINIAMNTGRFPMKVIYFPSEKIGIVKHKKTWYAIEAITGSAFYTMPNFYDLLNTLRHPENRTPILALIESVRSKNQTLNPIDEEGNILDISPDEYEKMQAEKQEETQEATAEKPEPEPEQETTPAGIGGKPFPVFYQKGKKYFYEKDGKRVVFTVLGRSMSLLDIEINGHKSTVSTILKEIDGREVEQGNFPGTGTALNEAEPEQEKTEQEQEKRVKIAPTGSSAPLATVTPSERPSVRASEPAPVESAPLPSEPSRADEPSRAEKPFEIGTYTTKKGKIKTSIRFFQPPTPAQIEALKKAYFWEYAGTWNGSPRKLPEIFKH